MSQQRDNVSALERQTLLNYQAAINYYAQRKAFFLKQGATKAEKDEQEFLQKYANQVQNTVKETIIKSWQKIQAEVANLVNVQGYETGFKYTIKDEQIFESTTNIPEWMKQKIKEGVSKENFQSLMGFNYEEYIEKSMSEVGKQITSKGLSKILSSFRGTGSQKSISAMRPGFLNIRPDLAYGLEKEAGADQILRESGGDLSAELQVEFIIEDHLKKENFMNDDELILKYLKSGMFGISVKNWTYSNNKKITEMSSLKNKLNEIYSTKRTWNATYAMQMSNKTVSNYLLDVIGPINIAILSANDFIWVDRFLAEHLLTMAVSPKNGQIYKGRKGVYDEIKPVINDSGVYTRKFNTSLAYDKKSSIVTSARVRQGITKKGEPYKVTMRLKRIK